MEIFLYILVALILFIIIFAIRGYLRVKRFEKRMGVKLDGSKDIVEQAKNIQEGLKTTLKKKRKNQDYFNKLKYGNGNYAKTPAIHRKKR